MAAARTSVDAYVLDTLMADLTGHDRSPASFLVYLLLWHRARGAERARVSASLQEIAEQTGLSKRGVQNALQRLARRGLVSSVRTHPTAVPRYRVHRPWIRRKKSASSRRRPEQNAR
jgi:DNA-binding MarR family transcriptional regulator